MDAINTTPVRTLTDNYVWILHKTCPGPAWVVDPGDAAPVIQAISQAGWTLEGILITHHHGDHTRGVQAIQDILGPIPVWGPTDSPFPGITHPTGANTMPPVLGTPVTILPLPGHTLDHIGYWLDGKLFCGDTLFSAGCGRILEGNFEMMWTTLQSILALPDETTLYPAHEYTHANLRFAALVEPKNPHIAQATRALVHQNPETTCTLPTTLGQEKNINPFLRCQNAEQFALIRKWKDSIG